MTDQMVNVMRRNQGGTWIRLRTMILIRWIAILGQLAAILVAVQVYDLRLELAWCLFFVGLSVVMNLAAALIYPKTKRLSELENTGMILFDLLQLSALLFLTGGLHNPFSILLVAPVVIASSALPLRYVLVIGITGLVAVTFLGFFHIKLETEQYFILRIADIFVFGNWIAISVAFVFLSLYARRVTQEINTMGDALFATQMALEREQKLTDLGGVVAAAAHELGTPLATIKLVSSELIDELHDHPDLAEDAKLIREQADRCRDIMRSMGRAGKDDKHMRFAPLQEVVETAAEPHQDRGIAIDISISADSHASDHPTIHRRPEIIHGLRNMIQNAVDFAQSKVWVELAWTADKITLRILDDGRGFPVEMIGRIGDPFVRKRRTSAQSTQRQGYDGMGLGLFIAKTLLERTGATLVFANGGLAVNKQRGQPRGAVVEITWIRDMLEQQSTKLGENQVL